MLLLLQFILLLAPMIIVLTLHLLIAHIQIINGVHENFLTYVLGSNLIIKLNTQQQTGYP